MSSRELFTYLKSYSTNTLAINRLVVSAFLYTRNIKSVKNEYINNLLIKENDSDLEALLKFQSIASIRSFEHLIELFEFVISPEDKVVNGAVYTPEFIREYIVEQCFENFNVIQNLKICDPACGCAGFLYTASQKIKKRTNLSYKEIFRNNIFGLDIEEYSVNRSKLLLLLLAVIEGEDENEFTFNLASGNALSFEWNKIIPDFKGFDIIVGNPPYVCSRNMDQESLDLMKNWAVTKSGHPDLYIPFFQIGYENLKKDGLLGYITVNTFLKSVNGRALRQYFSENKVSLKIINFGGEQVFKDRNTYTCLCFIKKTTGSILYRRIPSSELNELNKKDFYEFSYNEVNNYDGWNLVDSLRKNDFIRKIESIGKPFKEKFTTRNGIATLKNNVYKFTPTFEDDNFYGLKTKSGIDYQIERGICRDIVNANKLKCNEDLINNLEKIIFPYFEQNNQIKIYSEADLLQRFPNAYKYLTDQRQVLAERDKGNRVYEEWFAYGRRQSMDIHAYKLFFPHICERPNFVICENKDLLFYNGIAVISNDLDELLVLKKILESDIFFQYIKSTTKDYSSGYISMSRNYIKNFGIIQLPEKEKKRLLTVKTPDKFLKTLYGVNEFASNKIHYKQEMDLTEVAEPK